jgi:Na+-transporting methylmalonyl-CoA/oxaloacetate decarboxylase gamma subunit
VEKFMISYHWNPELDETPAFVMDMMSLLHKIGKVKGEFEEAEVEEEVEEEEIVEEAEEEIVEEAEE